MITLAPAFAPVNCGEKLLKNQSQEESEWARNVPLLPASLTRVAIRTKAEDVAIRKKSEDAILCTSRR